MRVTWLLLLLISVSSQADVLREDFSTLTYRDANSTAVWNIALRKLHPTLQVTGLKVLNGDTPRTEDFTVGDGSDGPFNSTTYSRFGTIVGDTIYVNSREYHFTSFELEDPYKLVAVGGPLIIYSQSTVEIGGTLLCSGENAIGSSPGNGRCGGGNGGTGGTTGSSGVRGYPQSGSVNGGHPGTYVGPASGAGGGGGGSYSASNGTDGTDSNSPPTNTHGSGGNSSPNHDFATLGGGAGGGGGSGSDQVNGAGGGGGGGGGTVVIHAVGDITITATGSILARGGSGGSATTGGGGGGGGGGSIKLMTAGRITLTPAGTPVNATGGAGGSPSAGTAGAGGTGSAGRTWLVYSTFSGAGSENPTTNLDDPGTFQYANGVAQTAISKSIDTRSTLATFESAATAPTLLNIVLSGSNDNFVADDSGWLPLAQISELNQKRFIRFKLTLTNTNPSTPLEITEATITFTPGQKNDFNFKSGGCGSVMSSGLASLHRPKPPGPGPLIAMTLLFFLPLIVAGLIRRRLLEIKAK